MTLRSYAQNFEDVMLWRALKHVENGYYIDVGAQHPVIDSVSMSFYEHGWRGVHVEPNAHYAQLLRENRPDENVIQAALSSEAGVLTFYEIAGTGLSTCNAEIAERHRATGHAVRGVSVPSVTLFDIFASCDVHEVHWLKIDVEGTEKDVLFGWKPSKVRPWIVVVESTIPSTQIESHGAWEKALLTLEYQFVYFDGLNRFYVSANHPEIQGAFRTGPNVFDGFVLNGTASNSFCSLLNNQLANREQELGEKVSQGQAELQRLTQTLAGREQELKVQLDLSQNELAASNARGAWLENEWNAAKAKIDELNHHSHHWWVMADTLTRDLQAVFASHSWRLTAPLRATSWLTKRSKHKIEAGAAAALGATQRLAVLALRCAFAFGKRHPWINASARTILEPFPLLYANIRASLSLDSGPSTALISIQGIKPIETISNMEKQANMQAALDADRCVLDKAQQALRDAVHKWPLGRRVDE